VALLAARCATVATEIRRALQLSDPRRTPPVGRKVGTRSTDQRPGANPTDNAHRPSRIGLGSRDARQGRQRDSARHEMQELSAGKFHRFLPASWRNACSDAMGWMKLGRPPIAPVLPIAMIGIRHVPLAARVKCYISFASGRKGHDDDCCRYSGPELADFVAKVESCRATNFSPRHETEDDHRFV
jgi:hypothetical protein